MKAKSSQDNQVLFDLSKTKSITPFGIILLTSSIRECHVAGKECLYNQPIDPSAQRLFKDIGFNKHFSLDSSGTVPPVEIRTGTVQLRQVTDIDPLVIEGLIEILVYHMNLSPGVKGSLQMSLIETMTNIVDHSGQNTYYVCCRLNKQKKVILLCIADLGIGILSSLRKSPKYTHIRNDHAAIIESTKEGVSSRPGRAGLGLKNIVDFLKINKGQLCILSGNGKVFWKFNRGEMLKQTMPQSFKGTVIKMAINADKEGFYFLLGEKDYIF
jgi:anti-sigma regulatory factor (Ser/Thr protein kinase)